MLPSPGQPAPPFSVQPPPARFVPPSDPRSRGQRPPPPGPPGPPGKVDMNGVERLAVDMMTIGLPPQVSPSGGQGRQLGGWHAMPPNVAPLSGQGPGPRIPTAIVPPGVPPHIRPPSGGQWGSGQDRQEVRPRSNPGSGGGQGGWSAMPPQTGGSRPGGSGRIMPGSAGPQDSSNWNTPRSGPGSGNGSQRGGDRPPGTDVFDIGTWENPGDSSSGGSGGGGSGGWDRGGGGRGGSGGWDQDQPGGGGQQWSRAEGMGSSNDSQWSNNDGSDPKWSSNDHNRSSNDTKWSSNEPQWSEGNDNKWSTNDGSGSTAWSTNDSKDEASFGTWENPKGRPSLKPVRNEEARGWGASDQQGAGGWGEGGQVTPSKSDWANNSAGSEISPSSAWKKETSVVGNWADDLQSPRDRDENPLDVSLKEARRSLSNW